MLLFLAVDHFPMQVGIACCQIARYLGAVVIGTAGTEEGMQVVSQNGASRVLNHRQPGYLDELKVTCSIVAATVIVVHISNYIMLLVIK